MILTVQTDGKADIRVEGFTTRTLRAISQQCEIDTMDCIFVTRAGLMGAHIVFIGRRGSMCGIVEVSRYGSNIDGPVQIPIIQKGLGRGLSDMNYKIPDKGPIEYTIGNREYVTRMDRLSTDRMKYLYGFVMDYIDEAREKCLPGIYRPGAPTLDTGSEEYFSVTPRCESTGTVLMYSWQPAMRIHMVRVAGTPRATEFVELPERAL